MDPQVEKLLKLPAKQKILIMALVMVVEAAALLYLLWYPKYEEHKQLVTELGKLQAEIEDKSRIVANMPRLQKEFDQLNRELELALTELPNSKEIPTLLTSITSLGKNAGLDFLVFKPKSEVPKDFYAEVPVDIVIYGSYFSVANFYAAVANLPRIVNINNVAFADIKVVNNRIMAKVNCQAITFRFLDKKEIKNDKKTAKK
ncbi:MAG TPA: type 4a pilus biogenesis protein PilO [Deltaproteobacteria bacterium]|nr:type 4a pilus biogenesis protein PilO [Deltaproteobacteria bacterium]HQB39837.1 type 4a pilus biogenesis protein PilO [Deltaproteobacteria bacterium]